MMRHYDNMGVAHALQNARAMFYSLPLALQTRILTFDEEKDVIRQRWINGNHADPDRYGHVETDIWGGTWETLVIFGSDTENTYAKLAEKLATRLEIEFFVPFSQLLRGYPLQHRTGTYSWSHSNACLMRNGLPERTTYNYFFEIMQEIYFEDLNKLTEREEKELQRLENFYVK